jgi:hypothetical protein
MYTSDSDHLFHYLTFDVTDSYGVIKIITDVRGSVGFLCAAFKEQVAYHEAA